MLMLGSPSILVRFRSRPSNQLSYRFLVFVPTIAVPRVLRRKFVPISPSHSASLAKDACREAGSQDAGALGKCVKDEDSACPKDRRSPMAGEILYMTCDAGHQGRHQ